MAHEGGLVGPGDPRHRSRVGRAVVHDGHADRGRQGDDAQRGLEALELVADRDHDVDLPGADLARRPHGVDDRRVDEPPGERAGGGLRGDRLSVEPRPEEARPAPGEPDEAPGRATGHERVGDPLE